MQEKEREGMENVMKDEEQQRARQGILFAIAGYTMWGVAPIYFKAIQQVSSLSQSVQYFCMFSVFGSVLPEG